ncbi:MAG: T9SS type B sorting domain-containing protein [Flavobacteriaceae bacterium]|nr:T9SS type B sorting domain-containing protein [Flavobacteriaceae bacterium]
MRIVLSAFLLLFTLSTFAQKEANFWYFGHKAGLDFSTSPPTNITGELNTFEGCSTISDDKGSLLFYSDGSTVWNKNHQVMNYTGGSPANNLLGNPSSTQSALVVPKPASSTIYYLFTISIGSGLNLYTVDVSKNGGLGEVTTGPVNLGYNAGWSEKVTAVEGFDCDTFWVISADRSNFYAYKVDANGVDTNAIPSSFGASIRTTRGALKVSPDGKYLVLANQGDNSFLFDFNTTDGKVTNKRTIDLNRENGYGVGFSNTSEKLYISTGDHSQGANDPSEANIYQFDLTANNINSSRYKIHSEIGFRGALQLGIDGRIYYARSRKSFLGVINEPNKNGADVKFEENGIALASGTTSSEGLPPFIQSFFAPVNIVDSDDTSVNLNQQKQEVCVGQKLKMEPELVGGASSVYKWTKDGDPSVDITTRILEIDNTNYGNGIYRLEMTITDKCGRQRKYNSSVEVEFLPLPKVFSIPVYEQCDFDSNPTDGITSFNLSSKEGALTQNASDVTVEFFETADTNYTNPVNKANYRNSVSTNTGNHTLTVRVTNNISGCKVFGSIELKSNATTPANYPNLYLTESDVNANNPNARNSVGSGNAYYDFDTKTKEIIANSGGAFTATSHTFEYYRNATDASLQTNQIVTPYEDDLFTDNSDVFVRVSTVGTSACSGIGQFKIFVNTRPVPQGNVNPVYLCVNNPIDNPQLLTVDLDANTGNPADTYEWYLNGNLITGATNSTHKANVQGTYKVIAYRSYQNNVADPNDDTKSSGYNTFDVIESNKALISKTDITDNIDNPDKNVLTVTITGIGDYEFALNSTNTADFVSGSEKLTYTFNNVKPGLNIVYVRDKNGCGITSSKQLSFLFFQRHFTPNNDGDYDTWKIVGANNNYYTSARVEIFDRFGKVLTVITDKNVGWDGTVNGKKLPSNDYWFNAVLEDINGNIRKETGHFSLLRK